ncbi:hypothetical protein [Bartonella krasnovii]|uniref:Uncharacterized protein n=1 Tax=Bartonella krasnovii TaxID=2267275 RepID=A0ABY3VWS3_9HYPH|nr:hypothetical protein [Bartonella krasnovii]UNF29485.1 hypothetical protein MNL13_01530 [Bartonella krasnovii]UNF35843.1 hypothetical protein MNL12_01530 [Bartonella krasnovii]UNF37463.1 hypothetical protein MNL11_01535 [Bartonella krasnovii]UNF39249.1 hypothetical protein MNL10_02055 [Bartonella krasnovii]UNF49029.1 hypothetical protein MNL04_01520 [Bartonella krasnovii]
MEPISIYLGAIVEIINILSVPGPRGLRALIIMSIVSIFFIIFSRYEWYIRFYEIEEEDIHITCILIFIAIIFTGVLLYEFPDEGLVVLACMLPTLFFWFLWHIGFEELTLLIIGLAILHFFKVSTNTLLMIIIFFVYLYKLLDKLLVSREYKKLYYTHNNLVNSYNLVIKDRDNAIRERDEAIEERDKLKKKFKHLNYLDDHF